MSPGLGFQFGGGRVARSFPGRHFFLAWAVLGAMLLRRVSLPAKIAVLYSCGNRNWWVCSERTARDQLGFGECRGDRVLNACF
jgi:hypothetical protein